VVLSIISPYRTTHILNGPDNAASDVQA